MDIHATLTVASLAEATLRSVTLFGSVDLLGFDGLLLDLDGRLVSVWVNEDDDTIDLSDGNVFPRYPEQVVKSNERFVRYEGHYVAWAWSMVNNRGYRDGLQVSVGPKEGYPTFQVIAIASQLDDVHFVPGKPMPESERLSAEEVDALIAETTARSRGTA